MYRFTLIDIIILNICYILIVDIKLYKKRKTQSDATRTVGSGPCSRLDLNLKASLVHSEYRWTANVYQRCTPKSIFFNIM